MSKPLILTEWTLPSGTLKKYASDHVARPGFGYLGYLIDVSEMRMELPHPAGLPAAQTATLTYDNTGRDFAQLRNEEYIEGTVVKILYGLDGDSYASFNTLLTGVVREESGSGEMEFRIALRDRISLALDNEPSGAITTSAFPRFKRRQPWTFRPIVFGRAKNVPCPYVDTQNFWFCGAQHAVKRIPNVRVYGQIAAPADYEVIEATVGGQAHTIIRFFADPEDPDREDAQTIVTADIDGATDTGLSSGTLLTNPADILEAYYLRHVDEIAVGNLDTAAFTATAAKIRQPFSGAIVRRAPHATFIGRLLQTFGIDQFTDPDGLLTINKLDADSIWATAQTIDDGTIDEGSWSRPRRDEVANRVSYGLDFFWAGEQGGYFQDFETFDNAAAQTFMGNVVEPTQTMNMWFVRGRGDGMNLAAGYLRWLGPRKDRVELSIPLPTYVSAGHSLGQAVKVTHFEGVSSTGSYTDELFKVAAVRFDFKTLTAALTLIRLNMRTTQNFRLAVRAQTFTWTTATQAQKDFYGFLSARATGKYSDSTPGKPLYLR